MKRFNLTGVCVPGKHYMVDLSEKVDIIIRDYIEQGAYFTINRARQFGKTTMLSALARGLADRFLVLRISFEAADDYFVSQQMFTNGFIIDIAEELERKGVGNSILRQWNENADSDYPLKVLGKKISALCKSAGKGVVLMIDEVDKCSDNQIFLNFLGLLWSKYLDMQEGVDLSFQSVILAGVYNVKNLRLRLRPEEEKRYNSSWNVAVDFNIDMSFSVDEIAEMLD